MKKIIITLLLLVGMTAMAQRKEGKQDKGERNSMKDFTTEQMATLRTKKMALTLDLSTAQQSSLKALFLENTQTHKTRMAKRKATRKDEDSKKPTAEERFTMQNAMLDHKIAQKAAMKNILSADQFTEWKKMEMHKHQRKGKKGSEKKDQGNKKS